MATELPFRISSSNPQATSFPNSKNACIMRVTFVLLAAMAVITSTAATNSEPTSISTNALVGEAHAIDTALDDVKDKRSLRSNQVREDNGGLEQDSEERLDATALAKLLRGHTNHKLELWKRDNHIAADVWKKLDVDNNPGRRWIYDNFMNHIGHGKQ